MEVPVFYGHDELELEPYDWLLGLTELDVNVARLVHAVGSSQDDVFVEDGSSTEALVVLVQEESLQRRDRKYEKKSSDVRG